MSRVDWDRLDAAAGVSVDRAAVAAAAESGIRRGLAVASRRLLVARVLAVVVALVVTGAAGVSRAVLHGDPAAPPGLVEPTPTSEPPARDPDPVPVVLRVDPSDGSTRGGDVVTIVGEGLGDVTEVRFGTSDAQFDVDSDTQVTATTPPGRPGTVDVTVSWPSGASAHGRFTYTRDRPTDTAGPVVTGVEPPSGPAAEGVTITGTGFTGATAVQFDSVAAVEFSVESDTRIAAVTPDGEPGRTVDVTVTTSEGTSALPSRGRYTYLGPPPVVTGVDPDVECTDRDGDETLGGTERIPCEE